MNIPLRPQSVMDVPDKTIMITQSKFDDQIRKAMGRASLETRRALAVANQKLAELEAIVNSNPTLQLEQKLLTAHATIAERDAALAKARDTLVTALAQLS